MILNLRPDEMVAQRERKVTVKEMQEKIKLFFQSVLVVSSKVAFPC